jgi:hypothetical protein
MILELIGAIIISRDSPHDPAKTERMVKFMQRCCWGFLIFLTVPLLIGALVGAARGQTRTYQDSMGRETGRSTTNGNTTTFSDSLGRNTGRAVTNGSTTTIYNPAGQQTGTIRSNRR